MAGRFLVHSYTLTKTIPVLDSMGNETYDEHGQPVYRDDTSVAAKKCLFLWRDVSNTTPEGTVLTRTPTLYTLHDDDVSIGDLITDIVDREGIILVKAARVLTIDPTAEFGESVVKVATLSGASIGQ